eukprot:TRINITY_DN1338_c0_g1_i1.p1 TRINITY_DN1338_c0_g1~~TRINITY_DN1338_c0_g1_i1.p1  ORF type:complete len:716 (+),score=133.62 TRINITY_DN1338_c0_g1_i1:135-2282(+)
MKMISAASVARFADVSSVMIEPVDPWHIKISNDLLTFYFALQTHAIVFCVAGLAFCVLRKQFPIIYESHREEVDKLKTDESEKLNDELFSPIKASWSMTTDQVNELCGLDHAMYLEFSKVGMRLMTAVGVPALLILMPIYGFCGGGAAGKDGLAWWSYENVEHGKWVNWVTAAFTWYVVVAVQAVLYLSNEQEFVPRRKAWLLGMPEPRCNSILVENIPGEYQSEESIQSFFDDILGEKSVKEVTLVKRTDRLLAAMSAKEACQEEMSKAEFKWEEDGQVNEEQKAALLEKVAACEASVEELRVEAVADPSRVTSSGFVTFVNAQDAIMAQSLRYTEDDDQFLVSLPPDPADVIYADLQVDWREKAGKEVLGYVLIGVLFFTFLPIVTCISAISQQEALKENIPMTRPLFDNHPNFAALWDALVGALGLSLFMSFVPTLLVIIFSTCFALKAEAWKQQKIQLWFFYFLVTFVLLVTAIGTSLAEKFKQLVAHPVDILPTLAQMLPEAAHFYLVYIPVQWGANAIDCCRGVQLFKFLVFSQFFTKEKAKELAEPEDQDYGGIGSRTARHTLFLVIGCVLCSIVPLITMVCFLNCFLMRTCYGFLNVYAETRKPDLGGAFWLTSLRHLQQGLVIYILLMTGVLLENGGEGPATVAFSSFIAWVPAYIKFGHKFTMEGLCMVDIKKAQEKHQHREATRNTYVQPELVAPTETAKSSSA